MFKEYDIIVVGAGHSGSEAAAAAANLGSSVLLITMNMGNIAQMSCNPAMGGIAKGQIVREIDALGGYSGIVSDKTAIQFKMLNKSNIIQFNLIPENICHRNMTNCQKQIVLSIDISNNFFGFIFSVG